MIFLEGPFLLIGLIAWTVAIVAGVGSWFGAWSWRRHWALAGGLAGLGTFELLLFARSGMLPVLVPSAEWVVGATAALFVGCGLAVSYGTLFWPSQERRIRGGEGGAEERLRILDQIDRLRPEALDWVLTGAMALPCLGMVYLGTAVTGSLGLTLTGAACALGPLGAAVQLLGRRGQAARLEADLEARELPEASGAT